MSELDQEREVQAHDLFAKKLAEARKEYDEAEQDYRFFVINRAHRGTWKPWEICGATDLPNDDGTWDLECQLPKDHDGRWHQEWSKEGRLLGEWS